MQLFVQANVWVMVVIHDSLNSCWFESYQEKINGEITSKRKLKATIEVFVHKWFNQQPRDLCKIFTCIIWSIKISYASQKTFQRCICLLWYLKSKLLFDQGLTFLVKTINIIIVSLNFLVMVILYIYNPSRLFAILVMFALHFF